MCFALAPCPHLVSTPCPHTCLFTLRPHTCPTPCLFTLRRRTLSYALSKAKAQATEAQRPGLIVLVLVLGPRYYRYCRACRYCRRVSTGIDRYRQVATGSMTIAEDGAPVWRGYSRLRGQARRQECLPHITAHRCASRDGLALRWRASAGTSLPDPSTTADPIDPGQPQSTTIEACERRPRRLSKCLLPLPTASPLPAFLPS